jgi:ribosomal protein S18 acetylase RimI-like enzyme
MPMTRVGAARAADRERLLGTLALAFARDPFARWAWPDAHVFLRNFHAFAAAFGGRALEHGSAHEAAGFAAGALWLPPGVHPDGEALGAVMQGSVDPAKLPTLGEIGAGLRAAHPAEPHWHLAVIGADPIHQGRGLGAALLRHALERIDREGRLAYLESSNPANLSLYQRHGFELAGTIRVGDAPPMFPMVRQPR